MKNKGLALAAIALPFLASSAHAHHSFAMFDNTKIVKLDGTLKEFEYINPHAWIHITVLDSAAKTATWSFEMGGIGQLVRDGWNRNTVKPGDKLTVTFHPLRDGSNGGQFRAITFADGRSMCQGGAGDTPCK